MSFREYLKWNLIRVSGLIISIVSYLSAVGRMDYISFLPKWLKLWLRSGGLSNDFFNFILFILFELTGLLIYLWGTFRVKVTEIGMGVKRGAKKEDVE